MSPLDKPRKVPRLLARVWRGLARGVCLALGFGAGVAQADIVDARYDAPTSRYAHAVLGDEIEYGVLRLKTADGRHITITLAKDRVFEDVAPRVVDVTGDGAAEVVVVESHQSSGARLAIYNSEGLLAATPYIGTRFRWLAPTGIGAADLDRDGHIELAYVDRPHLAKTLRVWRYKDGGLYEVANLAGVTNHRIGEPDIAGGIRTCGEAPEMIVADARWRRVLAVRFDGTSLSTEDLGPHRDRSSFAQAMACAIPG
ncbi:MAG: VCBS repeat-containing protein [Marinovum sp.]|nr:VCBS repeat-containing protein [Marinovum sp.]